MLQAAAARYPMLSVEGAQQIIRNRCCTLPDERVEVDVAHGRVLAAPIRAPESLPPFRSSAVDGYAVRSSDGTAPRRLVAEITAGQSSERQLGAGEAAWVTTGAPLPPGADAMVMVEYTRRRGDDVELDYTPRADEGWHPVGQDVTEGQVILEHQTVLGPAELGLLASLGVWELSVYRRPRVAILSTGDELVEPWQTRSGAYIRDSNRTALAAAVAQAGATPVSFGIVRDEEDELESRLRAALDDGDVVLTSGGVSMGNRDLLKDLLERLGEVHVGRISFKPGKPMTFATVGDKYVFSLPGFPVSSLVSFEVFVRPALRLLQGYRDFERPWVRARLAHAVRPSPDRTEYQRAVVRWQPGGLVAATTGLQVSSRLLSMVGANALLRIAPGTNPLPAGGWVDAMLVGPLGGGPAPGMNGVPTTSA